MTLQRWDVINSLLERTEQRRFLEIGVQRGLCGVRIHAAEKWGVDPEYLATARRAYTRLFRTTSDQFFEELEPEKRFDVVLVDGLHHADQVERDVDSALRHLADDGFIVLHDCNPLSELAQRVPRATGVWNGDCWKAMVRLRQRGDLQAFTIASDHGIGVVRRGRQEPLRGVPDELTYDALARERTRLLGLVHPDRWLEGFPEQRLGRVVVVSAIFGQRDHAQHAPSEHDVDEFVMFTDTEAPRRWRIERVENPGDPRLAARRVKALALELVDADVVLWVDGRIRVTGHPVRPMLRQALDRADIAGYPHPWRRCAYDEADECARLGCAPEAALQAQAADYRAEGLPERHGLWNTMVLARRRTEATVAFGRAWWGEIQRHTARDQVSFPYLLWRERMACGKLGADVYRRTATPYFERGRHRGAT